MKKNVGGWDRGIRILAGIAIIGAGAAYGTWWGLVGLIPLVTGLSRFCPAYGACGIDTGKTDPSDNTQPREVDRDEISHGA